jgi:hypothetical protein
MMAIRFFTFDVAFGTDCTPIPRLSSGGRSNHKGSRIPSKQSLASGYMAPLPSRNINGAACNENEQFVSRSIED